MSRFWIQGKTLSETVLRHHVCNVDTVGNKTEKKASTKVVNGERIVGHKNMYGYVLLSHIIHINLTNCALVSAMPEYLSVCRLTY